MTREKLGNESDREKYDPGQLKRKSNETLKDERNKVRIRLHPFVHDALFIMLKRFVLDRLGHKYQVGRVLRLREAFEKEICEIPLRIPDMMN